MQLLAVLGLGLLGFGVSGFGTESPISIGAKDNASTLYPIGARTFSNVSSGPIIFIPIHKPSHFSFVMIVKDDGKDSSGGWQEAKANLPFAQTTFPIGLRTWYCPITIGMPIRHRTRGYISPDTAASMSAAVTNKAASNTDFNLPQGIFCHKFFLEVEATFPSMYPGLGATVAK